MVLTLSLEIKLLSYKLNNKITTVCFMMVSDIINSYSTLSLVNAEK